MIFEDLQAFTIFGISNKKLELDFIFSIFYFSSMPFISNYEYISRFPHFNGRNIEMLAYWIMTTGKLDIQRNTARVWNVPPPRRFQYD